jgi:hypothetical protein
LALQVDIAAEQLRQFAGQGKAGSLGDLLQFAVDLRPLLKN